MLVSLLISSKNILINSIESCWPELKLECKSINFFLNKTGEKDSNIYSFLLLNSIEIISSTKSMNLFVRLSIKGFFFIEIFFL